MGHTHCCCGCIYVWPCVTCVMLSATVPGHDAAFLSMLFQRQRFEVFQSLTVGWNMSLLYLLLVYRVATHSNIYETIIIIIIYTAPSVCTSVIPLSKYYNVTLVFAISEHKSYNCVSKI